MTVLEKLSAAIFPETGIQIRINPELSRKDRARIRARLWTIAFPEVVANNAWRSLLKNKYGVSEEWYNHKLAEQGGCCGICGTQSPGKRRHFDVDHDHETGANRGLLCSSCNTGIGNFKENIESLEKAVAYLVKHKSN